MVQLQKNIQKLEKANIQVIAVSYDPVESLAKFAKRGEITYPLLADTQSKVIKAFQIYNAEAPNIKIRGVALRGVPYPGTFIIDEKGVIRAKLFYDGYRTRHDAAAIIEAVRKID